MKPVVYVAMPQESLRLYKPIPSCILKQYSIKLIPYDISEYMAFRLLEISFEMYHLYIFVH